MFEEIENELITPIKERFPYIEMRDNRTGEIFLIDWTVKIAEMINED